MTKDDTEADEGCAKVEWEKWVRRRWRDSEFILSPRRRKVDDKIQLKAQSDTEGGAAAVQPTSSSSGTG